MGKLDATIVFRCERVRRNNGLMEVLFQSRVSNGAHQQDEVMLCNLLRDRGSPEVGQEYEITIKPVQPNDYPKVV